MWLTQCQPLIDLVEMSKVRDRDFEPTHASDQPQSWQRCSISSDPPALSGADNSNGDSVAPLGNLGLLRQYGEMEFPTLDPQEENLIRKTAQEWASLHPRPETPVLMMIDGSAMTPRNVAAALQLPTTPRGRTLYQMFAVALHGSEMMATLYGNMTLRDHAMGSMSLEYVLSHFESDISRWRGDRDG